MRISDWSSDVCSSDLAQAGGPPGNGSHENAAFSHSCRSAIGRSLDQPGTTKLSLRDVCATALVRSHGLDSCGTPRNGRGNRTWTERSEEHTSELQSLMRISYAVFRLKQHTHKHTPNKTITPNTT